MLWKQMIEIADLADLFLIHLPTGCGGSQPPASKLFKSHIHLSLYINIYPRVPIVNYFLYYWDN